MHLFRAETADEAWLLAAQEFRKSAAVRVQNGRGGVTSELLHAAFVIDDPRQRWVLSRRPAINPAFAIAELVWIVRGRNDAEFITYWNREFTKYAGSCDVYPGAYGFRLRKHFGTDQLERAYQALQANPDGRQVVLEVWDPRADLPGPEGEPAAQDVPCNVCSMLKVRDGRLEWLQVLRSNDLFRGVPYNFIQWTTLQEILAGWLGLALGTYTHVADSLHVYRPDLTAVLASKAVDGVKNADSLACPKGVSDRALGDLEQCVERMIRPSLSAAELERLITAFRAPPGFASLLRVVGAETARRRGWRELSAGLMAECQNLTLRRAWLAWAAERS